MRNILAAVGCCITMAIAVPNVHAQQLIEVYKNAN